MDLCFNFVLFCLGLRYLMPILKNYSLICFVFIHFLIFYICLEINCFWSSIWMQWNLSVESHYTGSSKYYIVNSNGIINMTLQLLNFFRKWSNKVPKQELELKALLSCLEKTITMLERHRHLGHDYPSEWNFWYISS